jgi:putative oxidoreductase
VTGIWRWLARVLLSGIWIRSGLRTFRDPGPLTPRVTAALPWLPEPELVARAQAAVQVTAGTALALGVFPRLAATTLAIDLIPVTYVGHQFWKEKTPEARNPQITNFLKNIAMFGGLVMVVLEEQARRRGEPTG